MAFDLSNFTLSDQLRCGLDIRERTRRSTSVEAAAAEVVDYLYDACREPATNLPACALVRFFKTHPLSSLPAELASVARQGLRGVFPRPEMRVLTLLATTGDRPRWRAPRDSATHRVIPLDSGRALQEAPMISQLVREFGLDEADVIEPSPDVMEDLRGKTYGIFHVADAMGSPYIPAQEEFVVADSIRSVIGFGGSLSTGDLFAVIMFSHVPVPRASAERFRAVALDVKACLFSFALDQTFAPVSRTVSLPLPARDRRADDVRGEPPAGF